MLTTLLAWGAVYGLLLTVFAVLGNRLESLPFAVRLLIVSGILVALMANLVIPAGTWLVHRFSTTRALAAGGDAVGVRRPDHRRSRPDSRPRSGGGCYELAELLGRRSSVRAMGSRLYGLTVAGGKPSTD